MIISLVRTTFACALFASLILSGCATGNRAQPALVTSQTENHATSYGDLLYVADPDRRAIDLYSYPKGDRVGQITGLWEPVALCADGAGNVFVTNVTQAGDSQIVEYAHGETTPVKTLNDPGIPGGCAVNPNTGDLAVANMCVNDHGACGSGRSDVVIYPKANGPPTSYQDSAIRFFYYCGYDPAGNLYVDGSGGHSFFRLARLPHDKNKFISIRIRWTYRGPKITNPGAVEWDGKFLAIGYQQGEHVIPSVYRVDPQTGRIAAVVTLRKSLSVLQFLIDGNVLIAPNRGRKAGQVLFYRYPGADRLAGTINGFSGGSPDAVAISPHGPF